MGEGVGYVLRRFPILSETFVLNEVLAVEKRAVPVTVFSVDPGESVHESSLRGLRAEIVHLPQRADEAALADATSEVAARFPDRWAAARELAAGPESSHRRYLTHGACVAAAAARRGLRHLHAHFASRGTDVAFFASRITGIPFSFTPHAYDLYKDNVDRAALKRRIESAASVVAVSDYNARYLADLAPTAADRIVRIDYGIDLSVFHPAPPPPAPLTILSVARLEEKKGLDTLLEACRQLRALGTPFRCRIVGEGKLRENLEGLITRFQLADHVTLLGALPHGDVLAEYRRAHLFVLPCRIAQNGNRDGLPNAILEAMACGLPVITTTVSGIPEAIDNQRNGILVAPDDAAALTDAVAALASDEHRRLHLGREARQSVDPRFGLDRASRRMVEIFAASPS